ncbi:methylated-DNA--[protein]-cysteine S-methyltransferase [uncultured Anaerococcus sp.]|uniref:methylated-DNA--[protein]-cysteine S-methyltransferase n=1 Tax=uncultured Anaerococcus sp. TaxID=293428 RepID=UPI0026076BB0|nr:methylated-DNA--[protein]-cysteine S-methyltransferase [uncultured Anaerococcus sp.]
MEEYKAFYKTKIGIIRITYSDKISKIELVENIDGADNKNNFTDEIIFEINEYLEGKRETFDFYKQLKLQGTDFQLKVWEELKKIPYGYTKTYKEIAQAIGRPKAIRAVANAIGKNPIMIIIPCHRVIGSDGKLRGYAYGVDIKKRLLEIEKSSCNKMN